MTRPKHRLLVFGSNGTLSVLGDEPLREVYDTWVETETDPVAKKFHLVGLEDSGERKVIRICVLWEDVKGMQLEDL